MSVLNEEKEPDWVVVVQFPMCQSGPLDLINDIEELQPDIKA